MFYLTSETMVRPSVRPPHSFKKNRDGVAVSILTLGLGKKGLKLACQITNLRQPRGLIVSGNAVAFQNQRLQKVSHVAPVKESLCYIRTEIFTPDSRETERIRHRQETTFLNTCDKNRSSNEIHSANVNRASVSFLHSPFVLLSKT